MCGLFSSSVEKHMGFHREGIRTGFPWAREGYLDFGLIPTAALLVLHSMSSLLRPRSFLPFIPRLSFPFSILCCNFPHSPALIKSRDPGKVSQTASSPQTRKQYGYDPDGKRIIENYKILPVDTLLIVHCLISSVLVSLWLDGYPYFTCIASWQSKGQKSASPGLYAVTANDTLWFKSIQSVRVTHCPNTHCTTQGPIPLIDANLRITLEETLQQGRCLFVIILNDCCLKVAAGCFYLLLAYSCYRLPVC